MQSSHKSTAGVFTLNGLRVDPASGQINGPDGAIRLEPRVMSLLQMLAARPGEIVSRSELLEEIWPGEGVYDEALTQCVYQLRHHLGEAGGEDYRRLLKTVPKRGYILQADIVRLDSPPTNESSAAPPADGTPDRMDSAPITTTQPNWKFAAGTLMALVLLAGGWAFYRNIQTPEPVAAPPAWTIAVLPFLPAIQDHSDPALEVGMADTLITRLSNIDQLVVRPINAVRRFHDPDRDSLQAGLKLGVDAVLEGTIHRAGDELRVTARLLRVSDGTALWADSFDEPLAGVFAMQDQICARISAALELQLDPAVAGVVRGGTDNIQAYELFLRGRYRLVELTRAGLLASLDYFQQAIALDPNYAQAWLGLASANFRLPLAGEVPPANHYEQAREAALKALSIDDSLAEGHAFLGWVSFWSDHDWAASEAHFQRAIGLNPNDFESRLGYAHLLSNIARHDEALIEIRRAREINPLFPMGAVLEASFLKSAGKAEDALRMIEAANIQNSDFWMVKLSLAEHYLLAGRYEEALTELQQARKLVPDSNFVRVIHIRILNAIGQRAEAEALVAEMTESAGQSYVSPYHLALAYMGLGDEDQALEWLEKAVAENNPMLVYLGASAFWDDLRDQPEFQSILQRVNLADIPN